jgi:DtxR family Mn-dependent transcriptional regulator
VQIIRRHRLWELFLVEYLNYPWDEIHEEAERLEHITSDKLAERLDALLGYPERDPHGDAIPSARGKVGRTARCSLASTAPGTTVIVERVSDASPDILKVATRLGIALRKKVRVIERIAFDGSLLVRVGGKQQYISPSLAQNIFVKT